MRVSYYKLPRPMAQYVPPVRPLFDPRLIPPAPRPQIRRYAPRIENYLADDTNYFVMGFISAYVLMALLK